MFGHCSNITSDQKDASFDIRTVYRVDRPNSLMINWYITISDEMWHLFVKVGSSKWGLGSDSATTVHGMVRESINVTHLLDCLPKNFTSQEKIEYPKQVLSTTCHVVTWSCIKLILFGLRVYMI